MQAVNQGRARNFVEPPILVVRKSDLPNVLQIGKSTIDDLRRTGNFPKPKRLGANIVVWPIAELKQWLAELPAVDTETQAPDGD